MENCMNTLVSIVDIKNALFSVSLVDVIYKLWLIRYIN
jgi:hypothetical protein